MRKLTLCAATFLALVFSAPSFSLVSLHTVMGIGGLFVGPSAGMVAIGIVAILGMAVYRFTKAE